MSKVETRIAALVRTGNQNEARLPSVIPRSSAWSRQYNADSKPSSQTSSHVNQDSYKIALSLMKDSSLSKRSQHLATEYLAHYRRLIRGNVDEDKRTDVVARIQIIEKRMTGCMPEFMTTLKYFRDTAASVAGGMTSQFMINKFIRMVKQNQNAFRSMQAKSQNTFQEAAWALYEVGFRDERLVKGTNKPSLTTFLATSCHESGNFQRKIKNANTSCYGLSQINISCHPYTAEQMKQVIPNYRAAFKISNGGVKLQPWESYTSGRYRESLKEARIAAKPFRENSPALKIAEIISIADKHRAKVVAKN